MWCQIRTSVWVLLATSILLTYVVETVIGKRTLLDQETPKFLDDIKNAKANGGIYLAFYGDSILQCLRLEAGHCSGSLSVAQQKLGMYHYVGWAVGNEAMSTLMARMDMGAVPVDVNDGNITVAAVMIGHNGLGGGTEANGKLYGDNITKVYQRLLDLGDKIHVLALGLLPAGGLDSSIHQFQLEPATRGANEVLEKFANSSSGRVTYVDCSPYMMSDIDPDRLNATLMPDGVHMSAAGISRFADCLKSPLDKLLGFVKRIPLKGYLMDPATTWTYNRQPAWWYYEHQPVTISIVNSTSSIPKVDSTSSIPKVDSTSFIPKVDSTSSIPKVDSTSSIPKVDSTSSIPKVDSTSSIPKVDSTSSIPKVDSTSSIPKVDSTSYSIPPEVAAFTRPYIRPPTHQMTQKNHTSSAEEKSTMSRIPSSDEPAKQDGVGSIVGSIKPVAG